MFKKKLASLFLLMIAVLISTITLAEKTKVSMKPIHVEKSLYYDIQVVEGSDVRCLGVFLKNTMKMMGCENLKTPDAMVLDFSKLLLAGLYLNPHPKKILVLGLGIGTVPKALTKLYPESIIDSVDIDPAMLKVAKDYFNFKETANSRVHIEDGRIYVKRAIKANTQYDMVILDAFNADYIPEHMLTKEFLEEVKQILTPQGIVVANTFSKSGLYPNESATYATVFGQFYNLKNDNRVIIAQKNGIPPLEIVLANAVALEEGLNQFGVTRNWLMPQFSTTVDWPADSRILTDQYSPANLLNVQKP